MHLESYNSFEYLICFDRISFTSFQKKNLKSFSGEILGEKQWKWLELALQDSHADFHGIISSIQILTTNPVVESWGHFPKEKERFFELLKKLDPPGLFFLSGDVHHGELSRATVVREMSKVIDKGKDKDKDKHSSDRYVDVKREEETTIRKLRNEDGYEGKEKDFIDHEDSKSEKHSTLSENDITNDVNIINKAKGKEKDRGDDTEEDITQGRVENNDESKNQNDSEEVWVEVTSSGLTHTCGDSTINKFLCPKMLKMFASHRLPKILEEDNENIYIGKNFGIITSPSSFDSAEYLFIKISVISLETSTAVLSHTVRSSIHHKNCKNLHSNLALKITEFRRNQCYDRRPILQIVRHEFPIFISESVAENLFDIIRTSLLAILFCFLLYANRKIILH